MRTLKLGFRRLGKKGNGYCMMMPAIWLKNAELLPGDRLEIEMRGSTLVIKPEVKK